MPEPSYHCAIDLGSSQTAIVGCRILDGQKPQLRHVALESSRGVERGYIRDHQVAAQHLKQARSVFEKTSKQQITHASFTLSGIGLSSQYVKTRIELKRSDSELKEKDIQELLNRAEMLFNDRYPNKKILHCIPLNFKVDGRPVLGSPVGILGKQLEAKIIIVTVPEHHLDALVKTAELADITIDEVVAAPLADAESCLTYEQKKQGVVLVNLGSETTSISTFEHGELTSVKVVALGSTDITNDLSLGLQVDISEAESIKRGKKHKHPVKEVKEIKEARIYDIIEMIEKHLDSIKKNRLMPAGVVWTGEGSQLLQLDEYTRSLLHVPSSCNHLYQQGQQRKQAISPKFSTALGLCMIEQEPYIHEPFTFNNIKKNIIYWLQQLKP